MIVKRSNENRGRGVAKPSKGGIEEADLSISLGYFLHHGDETFASLECLILGSEKGSLERCPVDWFDVPHHSAAVAINHLPSHTTIYTSGLSNPATQLPWPSGECRQA